MIKGAIFDMDGLLFDSERIFQSVWEEIASDYGVTLGPDFRKDISGTSGEVCRRVCEKYYPVENGFEIVEECKRRIYRRMEKDVPVKPGVPEILRYFRETGVRTAVMSSSPLQLVQNNLRVSGLTDLFDLVMSGEGFKNGKPAPDVFLYSAEQLGYQPEECFVFEDSLNGVAAGYRAGCHVVMIPDLTPPTKETREMCCGIYDSMFLALEAVRNGEIPRR